VKSLFMPRVVQREAFQKLRVAIFAGEITTVVVWKLDRLARNLREGVNVLADLCQRGVRVIVVTQQIVLSGPVGHMINVAAVIALKVLY
jgi:DNA invertase Pin-like site-specific DNA recombinase